MVTDGSEPNFTVMTETYDTTENGSFLDRVLYGDYSGAYFRNYSETLSINYSIPKPPGKVSRPPEKAYNIMCCEIITTVHNQIFQNGRAHMQIVHK